MNPYRPTRWRQAWFWLLLLLPLAACAQPAPTNGVPADSPYMLSPHFEAIYEAHGGVRTFGYPISQPYLDDNGNTVQYFQNLKLQIAAASGALEVEPLGQWALAQTGLEPAAGATVDPAFQALYEQVGGEVVFGPALTPLLVEADRWVQYFENARLQWNPEEPPDLRAQVSPLGREHFTQTGVANRADALAGQPGLIGVRNPGSVAVSASVTAPILFGGEAQTVVVQVLDAEKLPAAGVTVTALLTYQTGETESVQLGVTDRRGMVRANFTPGIATPGHMIDVQVGVLSPDGQMLGQTRTAFKAWW